jgi:outer membrane protein OmpA-like peptidoglycan-associated protein
MNERARAVSAGAAMLLSGFGAGGCGLGAVLRGKIAGLEKLADQAERNGAVRCAPRELAVAKSHLEFAAVELDQGFISRAKAHVATAEPNVHAALDLSPPEKCSDEALTADKDGDGYPDRLDKCPEGPENWNGFQDADGCPDDPDTDGDGIPDSRDMCVLEPEDKDGYLDEDGCPDPDNDFDGIADSADKCPNEAEDKDGYEDQDGCPDLDNDKDKVADFDDQCPNEPGPPGGERPGCGPSLVVLTDSEIRITQQIHFEFDKDVIRRESYAVLDAVADVMRVNPGMRIEVEGHTDNRGSAAYNKGLSERRAAAVRKYLASHGVASDRLVSHGYGPARPLVPNDSEQNRALNRRVQFIRIEGQKGNRGP